MSTFNIALDGPSGVGKSTTADLLAERFGLHHLDTGAMYRAIGYGLHQKKIDPAESPALQQALDQMHLEVNGQQICLDGQDVTEIIRTPQVSLLASQYSALPSVRRRLVAMQQAIAAHKGYILDGRDICDVVLPDAEVKLYLDASTQARARRRYLQDTEKGKQVTFEEVCQDIEARDLQDRSRTVSPLRISENATVIDSSDLTLEQTVEKMAEVIRQTLGDLQ